MNTAEIILELQEINVSYGGIQALKKVNLTIKKGEVVTLVGANGAGKTTFLKMLNGDLRVTAGKVAVGSTVKIGYLSQQLDELDPEWRVLEAVTRIEIGRAHV